MSHRRDKAPVQAVVEQVMKVGRAASLRGYVREALTASGGEVDAGERLEAFVGHLLDAAGLDDQAERILSWLFDDAGNSDGEADGDGADILDVDFEDVS
jgi:hypothetical protein